VGTNDRADLDPNNVLASERNADLFGDLIGAFRRIDVLDCHVDITIFRLCRSHGDLQ